MPDQYSYFYFYLVVFLLFIGFNVELNAQEETVGLLQYSEAAAEGYTLFAPNSSRKTYLIDNCGYIINTWDGEDFVEIAVYLLEDGSLLRPSRGFIERRTWEDEQVWRYETFPFGDNHHDIEPLPNGNVLVIITEYYSEEEAIARGRNPEEIDEEFGVDAIYEIKPTGPESGEVVWKWSFWDHLIQDVDPSKPNYGNLEEFPRRLDINYNDLGDSYDWLHCNGIDYNEELDQIIISSRHTSELYIIDHSTTLEEAAGSTGGDSGFGGDFLWRWGNPQVYGVGEESDQKLYQQHNPTWIPEGFPDAGKVTAFNNLAEFDHGGAPFSQIAMIDTKLNSDGSYPLPSTNIFGPEDFFWTYTGEVLGENFWSEIESGVTMLPNGNFLACMAIGGRFVEVTRAGEVVWVYQNPVSFFPVNQFDNTFGFFDVFRAERYAPDYPAFEDRELIPMDIIENVNANSEACAQATSVQNEQSNNSIRLFSNLVYNHILLDFQALKSQNVQIEIINVEGKVMWSKSYGVLAGSNRCTIDVNTLAQGMYYLRLRSEEGLQIKRFIRME